MKRMREIDVLVLRNVVGMLGVLLHAPRGRADAEAGALILWPPDMKS